MFNPIGMINAVNSLAAVKQVIFDRHEADMETLYKAIEADWAGYEWLREKCAAAPKFGNNDPLADELAAELYGFWAANTGRFRTIYGEPPRPTGVSITAHAPGGAYTCATPDGRHAGETLCDGVMSPAQGTDTHGPLASLASAMKVDQTPFNAALLNMKIHPSAMKSDADLEKFVAMVRTYLMNGGKHIQFNVVDNKVLKQAQEKPRDYPELIVRVAGYSTYFTLLTPAVQNEIIKRTENQL